MLLTASYLLLAAQSGSPAAWKTQTFTEGVSVEAPVTLLKSTDKVVDPGMKSFEVWSGSKGLTTFIVSVTRLRDPENVPTGNLFLGCAQGVLPDDHTKVIGLKDLVHRGWPGMALTVRSEDGISLVTRTFRTPEFMIQVCASFFAHVRPPEIDRFLNSFRLSSEGDLKEPGAVLTRYPLGDSGITALFPSVPIAHDRTIGKGAKTSTMHSFAAMYALRIFGVAYVDLPIEAKPTTDNELDKARYDITELILDDMKGKKGKQSDDKVGEDQGLLTEYTTGPDQKGRLLVFIRESRAVVLAEFAHRLYDAPKTIDAFLHSVEIKPGKG